MARKKKTVKKTETIETQSPDLTPPPVDIPPETPDGCRYCGAKIWRANGYIRCAGPRRHLYIE